MTTTTIAPRTRAAAWRLAPWLLFLAGIAIAIPMRTTIPTTWDTIQYTLAVDKYDVLVHQPHPPGYFLYVMCGRLVHLLGLDPYQALVAMSIVASAAAVAALYLAGAAIFSPATGLVAALMMLTCGANLRASGIGETRAFPALISALFALICWRMMSDRRFPWWPSALVIGIAAGFRTTDAVYLAPLWLWALHDRPRLHIAGAIGIAAVTVAAWALPMLYMTGGYQRYHLAAQTLDAWVMSISPWRLGASGLESNARRFYQDIHNIGPAAMVAEVYAALWLLTRHNLRSRRAIFLTVWALPATLFCVFVHMGTENFTMPITPPMMLVAAVGIFYIVGSGRWGRILSPVVVALICASTLLSFATRNWPDTRRYEESLSLLSEVNRQTDVPHAVSVLLMTGPFSQEARESSPSISFRHAMYYLPQAWTVYLPPEDAHLRGQLWNAAHMRQTMVLQPPVRLAGMTSILLWDPEALRYLPSGVHPRHVQLGPGMDYYLVATDPSHPVVIGPGHNLQFTPADR